MVEVKPVEIKKIDLTQMLSKLTNIIEIEKQTVEEVKQDALDKIEAKQDEMVTEAKMNAATIAQQIEGEQTE